MSSDDRRQKLSDIGTETGAGVNGEAFPENGNRFHNPEECNRSHNLIGPGVQVPETVSAENNGSKLHGGTSTCDANKTASTGKQLSPRQALFVGEYLVDGNATRAAARAGYSARTAKQQGSRLLTVRWVSAAIREAMERRAERVEIKQDDVLRELKVIAFAEPGEKYKASDKVKALDLLGKHLKMWADKTDDGKVQIVVQREAPLPPAQAFAGAKA